jgi:hypothetical protein
LTRTCAAALGERKYHDDTKVDHYRWVERDYKTGDYRMSQWVNGDKLPEKFDGKWSEENCPYRVLTWDLDDASLTTLPAWSKSTAATWKP